MYRHHYPNDPGMHTGDLGRLDYERSSYDPARGRSWSACNRLQQDIIPLLVGCLLLISSVCLLCWNERRAVRTASALDEGIRSVTSLRTTDVTFKELDGHLVYCQGRLQCKTVVSDDAYGIALSAVKLRRTVEMYQWIEVQHGDERDDGNGGAEGTVSYSYDKRWMEEPVSSAGFFSPHLHRNPEAMPVGTATFVAGEVTIGNIVLSSGLLDQVTHFRDIALKELPENRNDIRLYEGYFYHSTDPSEPEIGDLRVKFSYAGSCLGETADMVSVVARQSERRLDGYQTYSGDVIEILSEGSHSVEELFSKSYMINTMQLLAFRGAGWLLSFVGFTCLPRSVHGIVGWLPFGRDLAGAGTATMNAGLAVTVSLVTIAMGWLLHRPWLCVTVMGLALLPALLAKLSFSIRSWVMGLGR